MRSASIIPLLAAAAIALAPNGSGRSSVQSWCYGDGSIGPCPCNHRGATGNGCPNSDHPRGANLAATGDPSIATDTLRLDVAGQHAGSLTLFIQASAQVAPLTFADGLVCAGGHVRRAFGVTNAHSENVSVPSPTSLPPSPATVSGQSAALGDPLSPGDARGYQAYYRDPDPSFCPAPRGGIFNVTNALWIVWGP